MSASPSAQRLADVVSLRNRYVRAVNIGRDLGDDHALDGYLVTEMVRRAMERLVRGLQATSAQRAWRLTGGYGSGKSAFGLFLATLFTHPLNKRSAAGRIVDAELPELLPLAKKLPRYSLVVINGARSDASIALVQEVTRLLTARRASPAQKALLERAGQFMEARARKAVPAHEGISLLQDVVNFLGQGSAPIEGVLLIVDEMGRWLEYAAETDSDVDASFFQSLAEVCGGQTKGPPVAMLGILHQRFEDYTGGRRDRRSGLEWAKIAERFEDITFSQSFGHAAQLIARAIDVDPTALKRKGRGEALRAVYAQAEKLALLPWTAAESGLKQGTPLYPFHPMGLIAALTLFRRFGQNERSAFSFLQSSEPFALQDFLRHRVVGIDDLYRVHDLCDWLLAQGALRSLEDERLKRHQLLIEVLRAAPVYTPLELQCLKTVGLLNLLEPQPGLSATIDHVAFAIGDDPADAPVCEALKKLVEKCLLYVRPATQELCLWPQSSVDVASEVARARKRLPELRRLGTLIEHLPPARPVVAHRHYLETGTLRVAHVTLVDDGVALEKHLANPSTGDGRIVIVPRYPDQDANDLTRRVALLSAQATADTLIAIRAISEDDLELADQLLAWKQVERECSELRVDAFARAEVQGAVHRLTAELVHTLADLRAPTQGSHEATWWHTGNAVLITDGRELNRRLSSLFDTLYRDAPCVRNELINRVSISSAAAAARQRLLERMFTHEGIEHLGIEMTPPEKAIYLSVLKEPGLHAAHAAGWTFVSPPAESSWHSAWSALGSLLQTHGLITVRAVIDHFALAPYGMRESVTLLLIGAFLRVHRQALILRERGTYLTRMEESHLARLVKRPETFELHMASAHTETSAVLQVYCDVLASHHQEARIEPVVADVARRLYEWYLGLPEHTLNTARLDATHRAALALLGKAADPVELLLVGLPLALGVSKRVGPLEHTPAQLKLLRQALSGLLVAGSTHLNAVRAEMLKAMSEEVGVRDAQAVRPHLIALGQQAQEDLIDYTLKAFIQRTMDGVRNTDHWLDSLASLLAGRSLETWRDDSLQRFRAEFRHIFTLLTRVVALAKLTHKNRGADHAVVAVHVVDQKGQERFVTVPANADGVTEVENIDVVRQALAQFPVPAYVLARLLLEYAVERPALEPAA